MYFIYVYVYIYTQRNHILKIQRCMFDFFLTN